MNQNDANLNRLINDFVDACENLDQHSETVDIYPALNTIYEIEARYSDFELLGHGALKDVFQCFDHFTQRNVAYARKRDGLPRNIDERLIFEAWLTASLKHPNIIKIHDTGIDTEGRPFFTMDLKGNTSLRDLVKKDTPRDELLEAYLKVCDAVAYAHSQNILHLDLKPDNIQCDEYGEVLVCDWGIAKLLNDDTPIHEICDNPLFQNELYTLHGEIKGSLGFMAPEQATPTAQKSPQTDIYALGCILYFILTQQAPYANAPTDELLQRTQQGAFTPLRKLPKPCLVNKRLEAILLKALAPLPEDRYHSVLELKADILSFLRGRPTTAERPSVLRRTELFVRRHKAKTGLTFLLIAFSIISYFTIHNTLQDKEVVAQKAASLQSDLSTLHYENQVFEQALGNSEPEIINHLSAIIHSHSKSLHFGDPIKITQEASILADRAIRLDRNRQDAKLFLSELYCIQLNFAEAVKIQVDPKYAHYARLHHYAQAFPNFDYTSTSRPSFETLIQFMEYIYQNTYGSQILDRYYLHCVLRYDYFTRRHNDQYPVIVEKALHIFNRKDTTLVTSYDATKSHFSLSSQKPLVCTTSLAYPSILTYLNVQSLELSLDAVHQGATFIDGLQVQHLDLCGTRQINAFTPSHLPALRTLVVHPSAPDDQTLRQLFTSSSPYQIKRRKPPQ